MFGMEKEKVTTTSFVFDLEKRLTSSSEGERNNLAELIHSRVLGLKEILRNGSKKEEFEKLGVLLNGYHALAIVLSRVTQGQKKKT